MAFMDVKTLYRSVIDEVTTRSRPEFVQEGVDEAVLDELRLLWEAKLEASGVLAPEPERVKPEPSRQQHPLGPAGSAYRPPMQPAPGFGIGRPQTYLPPWQQRPVTGTGTATVQTGQAANLPAWSQAQGFQQSQIQANGQQARPVGAGQHQQAAPPAQTSYAQQPQALSNGHSAQYGAGYAQAQQHAAAQHQFQLPPGTAQRPPQPGPSSSGQLQGAAAYASAAGQNLPTQSHYAAQLQGGQQASPAGAPPGHYAGQAGGSQQWSQPPQGQSHQEPDEVTRKRKAQEMQEIYHLAKQQMLRMQQGKGPQQAADPSQPRLPQQDGPSESSQKSDDEGEEEAEKEELENFSDVASSNEDEEDLPDQCISQFLKVQRTKNKWKCQLKGGIIHLKGRDHVFGLANGEFQF